jgi:Protein of unknown function (DUF3060)
MTTNRISAAIRYPGNAETARRLARRNQFIELFNPVWEHRRMTPQDDPEARIRELERSLSEQARTSELGTPQQPDVAGYSALPPPVNYGPPPVSYGAPPVDYGVPPVNYGAPAMNFGTPPRSSGSGARWVILGAIAVAMIALVGGIAAYTSSMFSTVSSLTSMVGAPPSMPGGKIQAPNGAPSVVAPGTSQSISGMGENKTIACNDGDVTISGMSNTVVITGHCTKVSVSGMKNVITVDAADSIGASGFNNQITFHSGSPDIQNFGDSNVVQQG